MASGVWPYEPQWSHSRLVLALGTLAAMVGLAALLGSRALLPILFLGLLFCATFALVWVRRAAGILVVLAALLVITPIRGALLSLAYEIGIPSPLLTVNALQPTMIAAAAFAALGRGMLKPLGYGGVALVIGWLAFALSAALNFATQSVGPEVYVLGVGQYLTYPTMAVLAWLALRQSYIEPLKRAFLAIAAAVSASIVLESFGVLSFVESADPVVPWFSLPRWGGSTGSYLHASMFLGAVAVLAAGSTIQWNGWRAKTLASSTLAIVFAGLFLTNSRGGFAVATLGVLVLLAAATWGGRLMLTAAVAASLAVGLGVAYLVTTNSNLSEGKAVGTLTERLQSSADLEGDIAHKQRFDSMKTAVLRFVDAPAGQKVLGAGVAATGNTRKLADASPWATESLPLKYLVEVGIVGTVLIGTFLLWAVVTFVLVLTRSARRGIISGDSCVAAAGLGLSGYALFFPILEPQLIALTWWLLLALSLKALESLPPTAEQALSPKGKNHDVSGGGVRRSYREHAA